MSWNLHERFFIYYSSLMPTYTPYPVPTPWINVPGASQQKQSDAIKASGSPQGFVVNPYSGGSNPKFASPAVLLFVAAVIKWEILGTVFLYVMVALLFVLCVVVPLVALVVWLVS